MKAASGRIRVFQADALSPFDFDAAQNGRRHSIGQSAEDERTFRDQRAALFFPKREENIRSISNQDSLRKSSISSLFPEFHTKIGLAKDAL